MPSFEQGCDSSDQVFGKDRISSRLVVGVISLPLGLAVELETIFEVED